MATLDLGDFWGHRETDYSKVVAQALALSPDFRALFLTRLAETVKPLTSILADLAKNSAGSVTVSVEESLTPNDRIDIYLRFGDQLALGIENKHWAVLQPKQIRRYHDALAADKSVDNFLLVFLAPSGYLLAEQDKPPQPFAAVTYRELADWCRTLGEKATPGFETGFFMALAEYVGGLELQGITVADLNAIQYYQQILRLEDKFKAVADRLADKVEVGRGNYVLASMLLKRWPVYLGFRIGTDWYFNQPLQNGVEVVVYVKDVARDGDQASRLNSLLEQIAPAWGAKFFPRTKADQCRLVVRKSLRQFADGNPEVLVAWFEEKRNQLEQLLPECPLT